MAATTKRRRMTGAERREQLIGVACALFARRGFAATSIEQIADRAGVSKPVVYEHFGSKQGVYAVVVDREATTLTSQLTAAFDAETPREVAEQAAAAFLAYIEEHQDGFRILVRDGPVGTASGSLASVISDVAARTEHVLVREFELRGLAPETAPMYARMLVGAVALVGEWWLEAREPSRADVAAHIVNLMWNGLRGLDADPRRPHVDLPV